MSFLSPDAAVEANVYMFPKGYKHVRETQEIGTDLRGPWVHRRGYTYTGDWLNGMFHGHGTLTSPRGGWEYVGGFERHEMEGLGELIKDSEFKYAGEFKYSRFDGQGVCIHKNGEKYEGEFQDGARYGKGTYTYPNGDNYVGDWKADARHGYGVWNETNVARHSGEWKYGVKWGEGTFLVFGEQLFTGIWKDDKKWGGIEHDLKGNIRAIYVDGKAQKPQYSNIHYL